MQEAEPAQLISAHDRDVSDTNTTAIDKDLIGSLIVLQPEWLRQIELALPGLLAHPLPATTPDMI